MSERGSGCGIFLFGGLGLMASGIVLGAYLRVQQFSSHENRIAESPTPTAMATAIVRELATAPQEQPTFSAQPTLEIIPMSPAEVTARINAHQIGDEFVVIRNDNLRILVKKKEKYLMLLKIYNGNDFWADRVLPEDIIRVEE